MSDDGVDDLVQVEPLSDNESEGDGAEVDRRASFHALPPLATPSGDQDTSVTVASILSPRGTTVEQVREHKRTDSFVARTPASLSQTFCFGPTPSDLTTLTVDEKTTADELLDRFVVKVNVTNAPADLVLQDTTGEEPVALDGSAVLYSEDPKTFSIKVKADNSWPTYAPVLEASPSARAASTGSAVTKRKDPSAIAASFFIKPDNSWERVMDAQGEVPEPRYYASFTSNEDCSSLYVFGGMTLKGKGWSADVFEFKTASRKWFRHKAVSKQAPPKLSAQTGVGTPTGLVVFGGSSDATTGVKGKLLSVKGLSYANDAYVFDYATRDWTKLRVPATPMPTKRGNAAGALGADGCVYYFGGRDAKAIFDDSWKLDVAASAWTRRAAGPPARYSHTLTAVDGGKSLILFGGTNGRETLGDMWRYTVESNSWTQLEIDTRFARRNHTTVHHRGSLFIFGGEDVRGVPSSLLLEFDLTSRMWSIVETSAASASNAAFHLPRARYAHAALTDSAGEGLWLFGGSTGASEEETNDLFEFTFEDKGFRATLESMLSNTATADLTIKTSDGGEVRAHKCVLYCRSPTLLDGLADDAATEVSLPLTREEVRCILKFLYTESFDPSELTLESLFTVISFMSNKSPARFAALGEHRAQRLINDASVGPAVNLAVSKDLPNLKNFCLRFIVDNSSTVLEREEMKTVDNKLLLEVISYTSGNKEPPEVQPIRVEAKSLSKDMSRLVADKRFADMEVTVTHKPLLDTDEAEPVEVVKLHRCIMVQRASWFRDAASAPGASVAEELGLSPAHFRSFTSFLYTDVVDFPTTHALHLLYASSRYGVTEPRLRRVCDKLVRLRPAREQLLFGLEVADELNDADLRTYMLKAIVSFFGWVGRHKYLDTLESKPELLTEILQALATELAKKGGAGRSDASLGIRAGFENASDLIRPQNVWMGPLKVEGEVPPPRSRHTVAIADTEGGRGAPTLFALGGCGPTKQTFSGDLYALGLNWTQEGRETGTWERVATKGKADARWGASLVHYAPHNSLWMFGGSSSFGKVSATADLFEYAVADRVWRKVKAAAGVLVPAARVGHAAVVADDSMFIIGGQDNKGGFYGDMYSLRIAATNADDAHVWHKIGESEAIGRANHSAVVYGGCIVVYGGVGANDTLHDDVIKYSFESDKWTRMKTNGLAPPARASHSATVCGNSMYVFGGNTPYGPSNELFQLNFESKTWLTIDTSEGPVAPPRFDHAAAFYEGSVFVFGGMAPDVAGQEMVPSSTLHELSFGEGGYRQRLRELQDQAILADVDFTPEGGVPEGAAPVRGHKPILSARAPTLLEDTSPAGLTHAALRALLIAVYTDQLDLGGLSLQELFPLLSAAQKHNLVRVAVLTERRIWSLLDPENVGDAINLCVAHNQENVKNYCTRFIWENQKEVLDRDTLSVLDSKLILELMRFTRADVDESALPQIQAHPIPKQTLREEVGKLAFDESTADAKLKCADGSTVPLHRCLVAVRSQYFREKFTADGAAVGDEYEEVLGVPRDVLDSFIKFVYSDEVDFPPHHAVTLLEMSKMYRLTSARLFEVCSKIVRIGLKQEEVLNAMEVADRIEDSELKEFLVQRIVAQFSGVGQSDKVKELQSTPRLITDILRALAISMS
jgi:N-acetylneuraminic acid mutarotase